MRALDLTAALGISADGRTNVGVGTNPSGHTEAGIADMTPACSDGIDNDGDAFIDYPNDPCLFRKSRRLRNH